MFLTFVCAITFPIEFSLIENLVIFLFHHSLIYFKFLYSFNFCSNKIFSLLLPLLLNLLLSKIFLITFFCFSVIGIWILIFCLESLIILVKDKLSICSLCNIFNVLNYSAFSPNSNAFLFNSTNLAGTTCSMASIQSSLGKSK